MSEDAESIVPHPRFGNKPRVSGCKKAVAAARKQWSGGAFRGWVFPESVIPADPAKQNYTVAPHTYYVDMKKTCRDCGRLFLFFAEEQRHWYEELRFFVDAECVRCPECRKREQTLRQRFDRYSHSIHREDLDEDSLATLVDDAVFLWEHSLLKNEQTVYRLRKMAQSQIPRHAATERIESLVASIRSREGD